MLLQELEIDIHTQPPSKEEVQKAWDEWFAADEKIWWHHKRINWLTLYFLPAHIVGSVIVGILIKLGILSLHYLLPFIIAGALLFVWFKRIEFIEHLDLSWILPVESKEKEGIHNMVGKSSVADFYISRVKAMSRDFMHKEYVALKTHIE